MKKIIIITCVTVLLSQMELYAQKVYAKDDRAILDMTIEAGMPPGAVTSTSKTDVYNACTPSTEGQLVDENSANGTINTTVYHKLEISRQNPTVKHWVEAFIFCKNLNEKGLSGWRLPTQRELFMIYIFKPALEEIFKSITDGVAFSDADYWSITEWNSSSSHTINFSTGYSTSSGKKFSTGRFRCVREVPY